MWCIEQQWDCFRWLWARLLNERTTRRYLTFMSASSCASLRWWRRVTRLIDDVSDDVSDVSARRAARGGDVARSLVSRSPLEPRPPCMRRQHVARVAERLAEAASLREEASRAFPWRHGCCWRWRCGVETLHIRSSYAVDILLSAVISSEMPTFGFPADNIAYAPLPDGKLSSQNRLLYADVGVSVYGALWHVLLDLQQFIFCQLTLELNKVWQRLCAVASPNIFIFCESSCSSSVNFSRGYMNLVGSRPGDHYFRSVCLSVRLSVCLCSIRFGSN